MEIFFQSRECFFEMVEGLESHISGVSLSRCLDSSFYFIISLTWSAECCFKFFEELEILFYLRDNHSDMGNSFYTLIFYS